MDSEADVNFFGKKPSNSSTANVSAQVEKEEVVRSHRQPKFDPEALYYDMTGDKFLIILNHYQYQKTPYFNYKQPSTRKGTAQDLLSLKKVFTNLGFKVFTYTDLEHDQILDTIGQITSDDHTTTCCIAVAILTHGDKGGEIYAANRPYPLKDITTMFEHGHPSLVNKPKLFFIQACRGDLTDEGRTIQYDGDGDKTLVVPSHVDFLHMFSAVEDNLSWRDVGGSWMIQEFCEVIKNHYENLDILQMITLTIRNVAYKRSSNTPSNLPTHNKKQTVEARFTLTKLVKF